jgi:hypothetical protein
MTLLIPYKLTAIKACQYEKKYAKMLTQEQKVYPFPEDANSIDPIFLPKSCSKYTSKQNAS